MARIRTIKPEFWQDEKIGPLDPLTRLVFLGLISNADDAGRLLDSPRSINGTLFPYTDDDCTVALTELAAVGVIRRGVTSSGQPIIQILGWNKHQKVEKPNLRAAHDGIADTSATRRGKVSDASRRAVIERANRQCELCGVALKLKKDDRYDSAPNLVEIDHVVAVADGGSDEPENLQALCLSCNRKKAGRELSERNRRHVGDASAPRPTIYDQRSTIYDQRTTNRS